MTLDPTRIRRILVRANNWIGDVVMISPAIRSLRETFRDAEIAILARPWVLDALAANRCFDRLIADEVPGRHQGPLGRLRLARRLRSERFDLAVLFQKAFDAAFLAAAAGIPVRVGHTTDHRRLLLTDPIPLTEGWWGRHHVDFFLEIAAACGCATGSRTPFFTLADEDRSWASSFLAERGPSPAPRFVAIHPGSSKAPRAWHAERYAHLAARLLEEPGLVPLVVGDRADLPAAREIASAVPRAVIAAGETTVRRMGALIERSALFVGNDSGPMHIAGALGVPTVGLFGPGSPEKTSPRGEGLRFEAVTTRYPCSPCRQNFFRECDPAPSGKPHCLESITVEAAAAACRRVLGSAPAGEAR